MSKGVLYDATKCIGCRACKVARKQWNELPGRATTWGRILRQLTSGYLKHVRDLHGHITE